MRQPRNVKKVVACVGNSSNALTSLACYGPPGDFSAFAKVFNPPLGYPLNRQVILRCNHIHFLAPALDHQVSNPCSPASWSITLPAELRWKPVRCLQFKFIAYQILGVRWWHSMMWIIVDIFIFKINLITYTWDNLSWSIFFSFIVYRLCFPKSCPSDSPFFSTIRPIGILYAE